MTTAHRVLIAAAVWAVVLAAMLGCSTTPRQPIPPYVGADCITTGGVLVEVIGDMPGGWFWVRGTGPAAPWMAPAADLVRCI